LTLRLGLILACFRLDSTDKSSISIVAEDENTSSPRDLQQYTILIQKQNKFYVAGYDLTSFPVVVPTRHYEYHLESLPHGWDVRHWEVVASPQVVADNWDKAAAHREDTPAEVVAAQMYSRVAHERTDAPGLPDPVWCDQACDQVLGYDQVFFRHMGSSSPPHRGSGTRGCA